LESARISRNIIVTTGMKNNIYIYIYIGKKMQEC
jgi:hypothetical protein